MTAFGPFAGTVEVDIDALAESGLFLLLQQLVEIQTEGGGETLRDLVVVDLAPGESRTLRLTLGRGFGRPVQIKVD